MNIRIVYSIKLLKIILYINFLLLLLMIFDKNNIEKVYFMLLIMIVIVYLMVDIFIICVVYFGRIGISVVIVVFCNKIFGNRIRWCCVIFIICFNCVFIGLVL